MRLLSVLLLPLALFACAPRAAEAQAFDLPIACAVGAECIIQNFADADPRTGSAQDPMCGPLTYDGHDGLDIRPPASLAARGVAVLAPAAGVIAAVRDGEEDGAFLRGGQAAVEGRDCGNGVRIDHADGWSSQLCHMRRGSIQVAVGDRVEARQQIGLIGLSGHTQFPHLHLSLRRNDVELDPLTGRDLTAIGACGPAAARPGPHWSDSARSELSYRGATWFAAGFTGIAPSDGSDAEAFPANASRGSPALVFWALASGPRDADVLRVRLYGPNGAPLAEATRTQPRDQAQAWLFAGQRTPSGGWPPGAYRGEATLERGDHIVSTRSEAINLR